MPYPVSAVRNKGGASDTTAPTVASFTVASPSSTLIIPIAAFTASEAGASFIITENSTPPLAGAAEWSGTAQTTYTVAANGDYTLYPWVKDAAGNVSSVYGSPASVHVSTVLVNLVAYWKLGEGSGVARADSTGRGNTLTESSAFGNAAGIIGNAADFASGKHLYHVSNTDLALGVKNFTIAGWFYKTSVGFSGFVGKSNGTTEREIEIFDENDQKLSVKYGGSSILKTTETYNLSAWNFFMVKRAGTTLSYSLNNGSVYTATVADVTTTQDFALGIRGRSANYQPLIGRMDEVGIWDRALSPAEITALYNSGAGLTHPF